MKVLYVEDDPRDADLTRLALAASAPHLHLDLVTTRAEALARLESGHNYDVVLTDNHLPDGDGLSLLARIREREWPVAVVIVTGGGDEETALAALKAGADDYVLKRASYTDHLPQILYAACTRHQAERARRTRPLRVLYAEDDSADISLTQRHLDRHARHIKIEVVHTAAEVLRRLPERGPVADCDVVMLDYRLPGQNALELLRELLQVRGLDVPVVVVTGQGDEELVLQVLRLGAADYVVKNPGYLYKLPSVLENAFHRAQLQREQAALRHSEARYRALVEQIPAVTYTAGLEGFGQFDYISPQVAQVLGYAPEEYMADPSLWRRHLHPEDAERVLADIRRTQTTGQPLRTEFRAYDRNGQLLWLRNEALLVRGDHGEPVCLQGMLLDLTERRLAEEQLQATNEALQALIEASPVAVTALDEERLVTLWNPAAEKLFGWPASQVVGRPLPIVPEAEQADWQAMLDEDFHGGRQAGRELRRLRHDGSLVDVSLWTAPLRNSRGQVTGVIALYADVSERKRAEAQLAYQAHLLANIHDAVIATDANLVLTAWNRAAEQLYGWRAPEVLGRRIGEVLPADFAPAPTEAARLSLERLGHYRTETEQPRRDGTRLVVEGTTIALHDDAGNITGYVSVNRDITERKQAEAEAERLHRQVRTANADLQALSMRLLEVQEAERRHLARELHDEIGQQLTGLKLLLDMNANQPGKPVRHSLAEAQNMLQTLMTQVRELSLSLRPAMLDDLGLLPALMWHIDRYSTQTGISVKFQHNGLEGRRLAPEVETAAYRIVQEALTNVARYAGVREVCVQLWREAGMLHLEVADEGAGFDWHAAVASNRTSGLAGMAERASLLGGQFKVESTPGEGTRLMAALPLGEADEGGAGVDKGIQR